MEVKDIFNYTDKDLYELMDRQGKERFGSECKHKRTRNGKCLNCFRKVLDIRRHHNGKQSKTIS